MKGAIFLAFMLFALFSGLYILNKDETARHKMKSVGIPTKIFGPYVFIYDGIFDTVGNLKGGIPQWVIDGGSNIAILCFLDPIEVEKSAELPAAFLTSLEQFSPNSSNYYVMISIGGWDFQDRFIKTVPETVAANLAIIAKKYNVGIELDCESDNAKSWIESFITAYRNLVPIGNDMSSVLTMDLGASPGAFPNVEQAALDNLQNLNWVNAMVYDPEQSPDNRMFWDYHKVPAAQFSVARNLVGTCDNLESLTPTLTYQKNGEDIKGILFWAALSPATCDAAPEGAYHCGTSCADCTGGVGTKGNWSCPALASACVTYGVC